MCHNPPSSLPLNVEPFVAYEEYARELLHHNQEINALNFSNRKLMEDLNRLQENYKKLLLISKKLAGDRMPIDREAAASAGGE